MKKNCSSDGLFNYWTFRRKLILKMKLVVILICIIGLTGSYASVYSQQTKLDLNVQKTSVKDVLKQIEDQSEFSFMYNASKVDVMREIDLKVEKCYVEDILEKIFAGEDVSYKIIERNIIIIPNNNGSTTNQQQKSISGKVTDSAGGSLPGVSVVVKGTTTGTITDTTGNYSLSNVSPNASLLFSFIGMKTQEIAVENKSTINVTFAEETVGIEEVVAIGYGTQKKVNITGAVGVANAERIESRPIVSAGQALQGLIPNLNVTFDNGDPSKSTNYNIRGIGSINGGNPLILVDGIPMDLDMINPNDILNVSVLKDAGAAAVYGARAAFGVILVETKKGKLGKIKITMNTEQSLVQPIFYMNVVRDPYVTASAWNDAAIHTTGTPAFDDVYMAGIKNWVNNPTEQNAWGVRNGVLEYYGSNDYQHKLVTDYTSQQKYDINISGATERASYYVSGGFLNKPGYFRNKEKNIQFKQYNLLAKLDFKIFDWVSLDEKISVNSVSNDAPHNYNDDVSLNSVARVSPNLAIYFPDLPYYITPGDHNKYAQYIGMGAAIGSGGNTFFPYLEHGGRTTFSTDDIWLTQGITITPLKGLKIRGDFSFNKYYRNDQDVASKIEVVSMNLLSNPMISNGFSADDYIKNSSNKNDYYVFNTYAEYTLDNIKDHYLKGMVGFNQELGHNNYFWAQGKSLITPLVTDLNATIGSQTVGGSKSEVALRGLFYRLNYMYKDKYLLEFNGRYDGTSRFPKDSRFGFFPSVSTGWRISQEPFMSSAKNWLDDLKIRASYGELGNQMLGNNYYPYISSMDRSMSVYIMSSGQIPVISPPGLVSPSLTWEKVATTNYGLDFTILKQRLNASFDLYTRDTRDMLMNATYSALLGATAPKANAASLRTNGYEVAISWRDKIGQDWSYNINLTFSDNQTKITKYQNKNGAYNDYYIGKKLGEIWGYKTEGIFQTQDEVTNHADQTYIGTNWNPGDIKYEDLNNDGKINKGGGILSDPGDMTRIGNSSPRWAYGFNPNIRYKNWTLDFFFQGLLKRNFMPEGLNNNQSFYPYNTEGILDYYLTESWSETNRNAYFYAPYLAGTDKKNTQDQSRYVQNGAYIRLRSLSLKYNLSENFSKKIGASDANIYFTGLNLWEHSGMHRPLYIEADQIGQEYYYQRIFTLGVSVSF